MAEKDEEVYEFSEPHITGGHAVITVTRQQIIDYMKKIDSDEYKNSTDDELVREFCVIHWAHPVGSPQKDTEEDDDDV